MEDETKPILRSSTFWGNLVALFAVVLGAPAVGVAIDPETQTALVGGAIAVGNIVNRFRTRKGVRFR